MSNVHQCLRQTVIRLALAIGTLPATAGFLSAQQVGSALVGMQVTQKRGVVCVSDDFVIYGSAERGADHCWELDYSTALGVVKSVSEGYAIVEYPSMKGWKKKDFNQFSATKTYIVYDYWGDPVRVILGKDAITFDKQYDGLLLKKNMTAGAGVADGPVQVRVPLASISPPPPRFGDVVVRGPDWNKGSADGSPGMRGKIIQRTANDTEPRGRDGYVTVEWEATKRKGRYRWDYHHKFDVMPVAKP